MWFLTHIKMFQQNVQDRKQRSTAANTSFSMSFIRLYSSRCLFDHFFKKISNRTPIIVSVHERQVVGQVPVKFLKLLQGHWPKPLIHGPDQTIMNPRDNALDQRLLQQFVRFSLEKKTIPEFNKTQDKQPKKRSHALSGERAPCFLTSCVHSHSMPLYGCSLRSNSPQSLFSVYIAVTG